MNKIQNTKDLSFYSNSILFTKLLNKKVNDNKNSVVVNLNISNQKCNRCGRNGHLKDNCFASSFENGKPINNNFYKSKLKKNIIK